MKLTCYLGIMICLLPAAQAVSYGTSAPSLPGSAPTSSSSISPSGSSSGTKSSSTTTVAPSLPKLNPKPPLPNNLAPEFKHSESYYRQPEVPNPAPTAYDSQELLVLIENQIAAIQKNDIARAYNIFTSNKFKEVTSLDEFISFVDNFPVFSKNKNAIFGNLEYKYGVATLQGSLTASTGETLKVEYDFVKEGPQWKIIGIKLIKPQDSLEENFPAPVKP